MTWTKQKTRLTMSIMLGVGFFGLLGALMFVPIPEANADIVKVLTGFVGGSFLTMVSFYFGDVERS